MSTGPSFDPEALIREAREETGLHDLGAGPWREGFDRLLEAADREASLNAIGRAIVANEMRAQLRNRLEINDWVARQPEIGEVAVREPLILATLPRTGQTAAGWLFDRDPGTRALKTWFVKRPVPPPHDDHARDDPRFEAAVTDVSAMPDALLKMHLTDAAEPDECHWLISNAFRGAHQIYSMRVPTHYAWSVDEADMRDAYAYFRLQLQMLQSTSPGRRWVLKNSPHLLHLDALHEALPDAHYVQFHRDPVAVLASNCRLTMLLRRMRSDEVDPHEVGRSILRLLRDYVDRVVAFRDAGRSRPWIDVAFDAFVKDPLRTVERIYEAIGATLTPVARAAMQRWIDDNPREARRPAIDLSPFGLDAVDVRKHFAAYADRFEIAEESA